MMGSASLEDRCQEIMSTLKVDAMDGYTVVTGEWDGIKVQGIASHFAARPQLTLSLTKRMLALQIIQLSSGSGD